MYYKTIMLIVSLTFFFVAFSVSAFQLRGVPYLLENWDGQASANSVDPDQMLHSAASDQSLHCLPLIQQFLLPSTDSKTDSLIEHFRLNIYSMELKHSNIKSKYCTPQPHFFSYFLMTASQNNHPTNCKAVLLRKHIYITLLKKNVITILNLIIIIDTSESFL